MNQEMMMSDHTTDGERTDSDVPEEALDDLDTETVEDLDTGDAGEDVRGGTTWACVDGHHA